MPKVSVIMSTYNRADTFLVKAIQSVLSQTEKDFELLVVDDCSTDATEKVVQSFGVDDKRVKYHKLMTNSGSDTKPKNIGLQNATGQYVAYLDDDCEFYPFHLEMLLQKIEKEQCDFVYCDAVIRTEEGEFMQAIAMDFDAQFLLNRNYIDTNCVLHKTSLAFAVGGFDETLPRFIDWNMWVRMAKWGATMIHVPVVATVYNSHKKSKSATVAAKSWRDPMTGMVMFEPTFDPAGCYIKLDYLDGEKEKQSVLNDHEKNPRVAIFTITYDRLEYTKEMIGTLMSSTNYPFAWFVYDNGSTDGTPDFIKNSDATWWEFSPDNKGITIASNKCLDAIMESGYTFDIVIKVDNDAVFMTKGWLETIVDLWRRNHMLYMSPYPEGLVHNPGGAPRVGSANIGEYFVEVTDHIGGFVAAIDARAYQDFRFTDQFLHGNQDVEASKAFRKKRYMPCYIPQHRVLHNDTTTGQYTKYPEYFERRKKEKTQTYEEKK